MRRIFFFLLFLSSLAALAQTLTPVTSQHSVWRAGDDADGKLGWADSSLDPQRQ